MAEIILQSGMSTIEIEDGIAILTLENGAKNLLSNPEFISLDALKSVIEKHPELYGLIITGKGRHFSHGADTSTFQEDMEEGSISEMLEKSKAILSYIEQLPLITVAAIHGGCFGGGFEIALSCRYRLCVERTFLGLPEIMHGVIPGMGGMERMKDLLGPAKAAELILSGEMITATEAKELGLIHSIYDGKNCVEEAKQFIKKLAAGKKVSQIHAIMRGTALKAEGKEHAKYSFERVLKDKSQALIFDTKSEVDE